MIISFGAIYMNLDMKVKKFPNNGEIVHSPTYKMSPAGKAASQALASIRAGAKTALVGRVGDEGMGLRILQNLKRNGVMTSGVSKCTEYPTGICSVIDDGVGRTRKIIAQGANGLISADLAPSDIFHADNILLVQLEIPLEQNAVVMKAAKDKGARVVLNLSPSTPVPLPLLHLCDYIILNEIQILKFATTLQLDANKDIKAVMRDIAYKARVNVVTYKQDGCAVLIGEDGKGLELNATHDHSIVDMAGATDCFCGTFVACLHEKRSLTVALKMASAAFLLSAEKEGIQNSYPYLEDLNEEIKTIGEVQPI